jgi:hypothetical protein
VLNNEDQMVRALEKLVNNVEGTFSEGRNRRYGRCKVYLVSNSNKQVLGGFNLATLEDIIFDIMKQLALGSTQPEEKHSCLDRILLKMKQRNVRLPYPMAHYMQLFKESLTVIEHCQITQESMSRDWDFILKMALYLYLKKIPSDKFGPSFIKNKELREYLSELSM